MTNVIIFDGKIAHVDSESHTITICRSARDDPGKLTFHIAPTARIPIGTEDVLLIHQLQVGDQVTVSYETPPGEQKATG